MWKAQATTEPSSKMAANAPSEAWICCTPFSWSWTAELSSPKCGRPQVTTEPSSKMAANAPTQAWICRTPFSWSWTAELSESPQVTTPSPPQHHSAKAVSVAANFACPTIAVSWSPSSSPAAQRGSDGLFKFFPFEVTSLRKCFPRDSCVNVFKSPTVAHCGKARAVTTGKRHGHLEHLIDMARKTERLGHLLKKSLLNTNTISVFVRPWFHSFKHQGWPAHKWSCWTQENYFSTKHGETPIPKLFWKMSHASWVTSTYYYILSLGTYIWAVGSTAYRQRTLPRPSRKMNRKILSDRGLGTSKTSSLWHDCRSYTQP